MLTGLMKQGGAGREGRRKAKGDELVRKTRSGFEIPNT